MGLTYPLELQAPKDTLRLVGVDSTGREPTSRNPPARPLRSALWFPHKVIADAVAKSRVRVSLNRVGRTTAQGHYVPILTNQNSWVRTSPTARPTGAGTF